MVKNNEMCKTESLCKVLEPFEATDILGGPNYVTGSCGMVKFHNLIKALEPKLNESSFILDAKKAIKADLSVRNNILGRTVASALDP
jgi:hypothetical protein